MAAAETKTPRQALILEAAAVMVSNRVPATTALEKVWGRIPSTPEARTPVEAHLMRYYKTYQYMSDEAYAKLRKEVREAAAALRQ